MSTGYKRPLTENDIWAVNPNRSAEKMTTKARASFERRLKNGDKYPLLWAMHETFFFEFWLGGFCSLCSSIFQVVSPFTLRYLIQFAQDAWNASQSGQPPPAIGPGIGLAFGVTLMQMCQSLGITHFIYRGMLIGGQTRAVLISLIFEKSLVLSGRAKAGGKEVTEAPAEEGTKGDEKKEKEGKSHKSKKDANKPGKSGVIGDGTGWSNGRIVNLMSVDTYRLDQASALFHMLWTGPVICIITLVLLIVNLSYSALAGFALLVIGVPALTRAIRLLFRRRTRINKITDQRVGLTQEILSSIRFVKYFGWESAFKERLSEIRGREIRGIQVLLAIRNAINAVSMSLPIYASMLSFITYSLTDNRLAPAAVFSSLALFNGLRLPLNLLPLVIGQVVDAWQSLQRIQEFMLSEEQEEHAEFNPESENAITMSDASFTWERTPTQDPADSAAMNNAGQTPKKGSKKVPVTSENNKSGAAGSAEESSDDTASTLVEERVAFKLQHMNLEIGRNELVAVIGSVGSGKTSLLAALAGDMRKTSGEVVFGASKAFCPQYAWIQNATVRQNILFGKEMDREWYKRVIKA
ncbi:ATP-binding cassette transporter yor1 [Diatrype stigma]|uniref:ATP-binding cassette transporter yor1 n=1 Tax=Diatrype stigma TaxID=117547 RepID=A0AAN9V2I5_9PEZI